MKVEYWIKTDGKWKQVTSEKYWSFDGEKELRAVTWRLALLQKYLQPFRW